MVNFMCFLANALPKYLQQFFFEIPANNLILWGYFSFPRYKIQGFIFIFMLLFIPNVNYNV